MPSSSYQRKPLRKRTRDDLPTRSEPVGSPHRGTRVGPKKRSTRRPLRVSLGSVVSLLTLYFLFVPGASLDLDLFSRNSDAVPRPEPRSEERPAPKPAPPLSPGVPDDVRADLNAAPVDLASLIAMARSRSVTIQCLSDGRFSDFRGDEQGRAATTQGSGWPLDPTDLGAPAETGSTLVVTNGHVVADCVEEPTVFVEGRGALPARVRAIDWDPNDDEGPDLAILVVNVTIPTLPVARDLTIGQWVMASGSPLGLTGTVTFGAVANVRGATIFTDAAIGPGNSGGPLFDSRGRVIGTNKAVYEDFQGLSIADSVDALCRELLSCG